METWRPVVGFEEYYAVSDLGRVKRVKAGQGAVAGRILTLKPHPQGYRVVTLSVNGVHFDRLVHVLVAAAFKGPCPPGEEVNHEDGDKANNVPSNLVYGTRAYNMQHAYRTGLLDVSHRRVYANNEKPCVVCGQNFKPDRDHRVRAKTCSDPCLRRLRSENMKRHRHRLNPNAGRVHEAV